MFTVNTEKVCAALIWLKAHHTGYQSVTIDDMELDRWPPVFMTEELLDSIAQVSSSVAKDCARGSFSVTPDDVNFEDQMFTSSAMVDVNCVSISSTSVTLQRLAELTDNHTINIVMGNRIKQDFSDPSYFPTAFPPEFPYGTGGFIDNRH